RRHLPVHALGLAAGRRSRRRVSVAGARLHAVDRLSCARRVAQHGTARRPCHRDAGILADAANVILYSGPAYLPAVSGNIDLTIFIFEMSAVASMCKKMAASRKIFST